MPACQARQLHLDLTSMDMHNGCCLTGCLTGMPHELSGQVLTHLEYHRETMDKSDAACTASESIMES